MHSIEYNYAPPAFSNTWGKNTARDLEYNLRNADLFITPNVRIELFRKNPLVALPVAWNELGIEFRLQHNRTTFKIALTDHILDQMLTA
jgi:hypothetical protein